MKKLAHISEEKSEGNLSLNLLLNNKLRLAEDAQLANFERFIRRRSKCLHGLLIKWSKISL